MPSDTLNVAVVGCGIFGEVHVGTYADFDRSHLAAVCDIDEARAKSMADKYGCRACTSVDEIAADGSIDAVSVATPDFAHRDVCVALAKAGKHLLIEKPLATTVEDARAIADAVEAAGVQAMVDFHNRYNPALTAVKERLDGGEMGRPLMMFGRLSDRIEVATDWFSWSGRTGPEWFLGSHLSDVACWLFDQYPTRVYAEGRKDVLAARGVDCYDAMHMHLSFADGFATLENSWILPNTWPMVCDFFVSLQTTDARADVELINQGVTISDGKEYGRPFLYGKTPVGADEFGFMSFPIRAFVRSILDETPPPIPLDLGLKNVQLLAAAVQSAQTGQPVPLGT